MMYSLNKFKLRERLEKSYPSNSLPLEKARTLPNYWYFDEDIYQAEMESLLSTWQMVGWKHQLEKPGSYIATDVANCPISVVRDSADLKLRAFHNVCRHRGAQVLQGCGTVSKMRCPYHGWTYDLRGQLRGTPEFEGVQDFCHEDNGLPEISVETFGPLVFVADKPLCPLNKVTSALGNLPDYRFFSRKSYDLNCNWKVFVDNYLDGGYHVNYVHHSLAGVIDYKEYRTHLHELSNVQVSPLKKDGSVDDVRSGDKAYYWWLFPNLMVNIYDNTFDVNLVIPTSKNTCRVYIDFFFDDSVSGEWCHKSVNLCDQIQIEDVGICESVQKGLQSKSYYDGRFSIKREAGAFQFHQLWWNSLVRYLQ